MQPLRSGAAPTTQIGYVNRHNQQCEGQRGVPGTDHRAVAYRMRAQAALNGTPNSDNISYYTGLGAGGLITSPDQVDPSQFKQPHCLGAADVTP